MVIREKKPSGKGSIEYIIRRINDGVKKTDNLRDVWNILEPDIKDSMRYEFSNSNPNKWERLNDKYKQWKKKKGYPITIGILTGALKKASTDSAVMKKQRKKFLYSVNMSIRGYKGKATGDYAEYFNNKRPLFGYTKNFINNIYKEAVRKELAWAKQ